MNASTISPTDLEMANQNHRDYQTAIALNKSHQVRFINLVNPSEYVNTLAADSAYIRVGRYQKHRVSNHEEMEMQICLFFPERRTDLIVLKGKEIWAKFPIDGGKNIGNRYYWIAPTQAKIDEAIQALTKKYQENNG